MVTPTKVRAGRVASLLGGVQSAKGTPLDSFTTGTAGRLWDDETEDGVPPVKSDPSGWMTKPQLESAGRYTDPRPFLMGFSVKATPFSLELLLRSNWGPFAAGAFTLADQVNEWLSLVLVENNQAGATEYWHRIYDAWVHRLTLAADLQTPLTIVADAAAERSSAVTALDAPGGTFGPSAQLPVGDKNVFPGRLVRLFRDPAGVNQELALHALEVVIDQGLGTEDDMLRGITSVFKQGNPGPRVTLKAEAILSAEAWVILTRAIAGTKERYRLTATAQAPAKTFQMDFYEVDFEADPIGRDGQQYVKFSGMGQAHRDDSGNFVSISLT